jgi:hypothetical protein
MMPARGDRGEPDFAIVMQVLCSKISEDSRRNGAGGGNPAENAMGRKWALDDWEAREFSRLGARGPGRWRFCGEKEGKCWPSFDVA